ncbi:MAG: hypothetical protein E7345_04310 [Clostridiales bacterium]|nr:hypothetical protein [Clostridiales bacterium]
MNEDVKKYFEDKELWDSLPKRNNVVRMLSDRINITNKSQRRGRVRVINVDDIEYYRKIMSDYCRIVEIASSEMYNNVGLITPNIHVMTANDKDKIIRSKGNKYIANKLYTATKNALNIPGYECVCAYDVLEKAFDKYYTFPYSNKSWKDFFENKKWEMLYNKEIKDVFLNYMTKECFDEYVNMYLLDELRTECDRHTANFIFYKKEGEDKYQGVIPIDMEYMDILSYERILTDKDFDEFITKSEYSSYTPSEHLDFLTYDKRMRSLLNLVTDGVLSDENIEILRHALAYDLPSKISEICKNPYFKSDKKLVVEPFSRLWDYNQNTLGRELGM